MTDDTQSLDAVVDVDTSVDTGVVETEELPDGVEPLPVEETDATSEAEAEPTEPTAEPETKEDAAESAEDAKQEETVDAKEKARREWAERREKRNLTPELERTVKEFQQNIDTSDWEQRVQALEAERQLEKVNNNLNTASFELVQAQKDFDVFNPESNDFDAQEAELVAQELLEVYGVYNPNILKADGTPQLLGFANPKTGEEISPYQLYKREAERIQRHREAGARIGQQREAKMRAVAETPSVARPKVDTRDDSKLTADEYAKKYNLGVVGG